eukprot:TRINITY_DN104149_c0_g1_i1.p1 TRINITY_DN104149_c0_g1~~TRINITY_DN104149_c0_g1_i1.p1  ORF type:complete len:541 (-),score=91.59 TRINITY_DN104149_c0_g1_i1:151-1773(-)
MGTGASVHELALAGECSLPSLAKVEAAHMEDKYRVALERHQQFLEREKRLCPIAGFEASAPYTRPLLQEKMDRILHTLDDVATSHAEDQRRQKGHAEAATLALAGGVRGLRALGDDASIACAGSDGSLFTYNWREGSVVARLRGPAGVDSSVTEGNIVHMCPAAQDSSLLATGDDFGFMAVWDLASASRRLEARLHEGTIAGLCYEEAKDALITTSTDTYIMVYDLQRQQVVDRAVPKSFSDGCGVQNSALALASGGERRGLLLVCGGDGKVRLWTKDDAGINRLGAMSCWGCQPTRCLLAPCGNIVAVSAAPGDPVICSGKTRNGGVFFYDLRKLSDGQGAGSSPTALLAECLSESGPAAGALDMALCEDGKDTLAMALMDGVVKTFRMGSNGPLHVEIKDDETEGPSDAEEYHPGIAIPEWSFSSSAPPYERAGVETCALAASGCYLFTATSAPSLSVWRRTDPDKTYGHTDYVRPEALPPMTLTLKIHPLTQEQVTVGTAPGAVLAHVLEAHARDRQKAEMLANVTYKPSPPVAAAS